MTTSVLICDDSGLARKQMARALPCGWHVQVHYASDGQECLEKLRQGLGSLLFLDLNMPGTDGYGVLEIINCEDLPTLVIVVSGDVQSEARERVKRLGAIDFIRKPSDPQTVARLLRDYGLFSGPTGLDKSSKVQPSPRAENEDAFPIGWQDALQEMSNVAMGRAGDLLAQLLKVFIKLPIPRVNTLAPTELRMALGVAEDHGTWSGVCQGFIGAGIAGEALLLFSDGRFEEMAQLLGYVDPTDGRVETEVQMDLSSILVGAFLNGLGEQLDISFGISHPSVLGKHLMISDLLEHNTTRWQEMLSIELNYSLENYDVCCDLLLLFAEDASADLQERIKLTMDLPHD